MPPILPAITWLMYAVPAYVVGPLIFRLIYGRPAFVERFPPRSLYDWMDTLLGASIIGYSAWIVFGPAIDPVSVPAGLAIYTLGFGLRVWAVIALGPSWRIGQDPDDQDVSFVTRGPYRFMHHPINTALVLVAIGQALMTGLDARAIFLLAVSVIYMLVQGRLESRFWRAKLAGRGEITR